MSIRRMNEISLDCLAFSQAFDSSVRTAEEEDARRLLLLVHGKEATGS